MKKVILNVGHGGVKKRSWSMWKWIRGTCLE